MTINNSKPKYKYLDKYKDMLLQCIACGDCREAFDITSKPPKWGVCPVRDHTSGFEPFFARGKMQIVRSIWQNKLGLSKDMAQVIYQCPTCNACAETCNYNIDNTLIYEALRAELVDAGYELDSHKEMNEAMLKCLNPYNRDKIEKNKWIKEVNFEIKDASSEQAEVLYYVGCTAALTPEIQNVAINTAKVLKKLDVDFSIYGENEICCGSVAMRTGNRSAFNEMVRKNSELFEKSGVKTIITSCAGCYRTLKLDYKRILEDLDIEVLHSVEYIIDVLLKKGVRLKDLGIIATYHDPCHTGRHIGLYEEPRELLKKMAKLIEMDSIKNNANCCGAGGGVKKGYPELSLEIAKARVKEAEETGAQELVSICPFCFRNLNDAIKALQSDIQMVDLLELINQALE